VSFDNDMLIEVFTSSVYNLKHLLHMIQITILMLGSRRCRPVLTHAISLGNDTSSVNNLV